jgi:hypothetical protein
MKEKLWIDGLIKKGGACRMSCGRFVFSDAATWDSCWRLHLARNRCVIGFDV